MSEQQLEEMGPIDYIVLEWAGEAPVTGEVMPLLARSGRSWGDPDPGHRVHRQGRGRVGDGARLRRGSRGRRPAEFEGASSGLLGQEDLEEAAAALEPGTVAAVLVWENRWAAPVAVALRRSGGQLVASGRIPVQAILASLDAIESIH